MKLSQQHSPVALVTGGGRRLGRHIVLALARSGFDVAINYHESREGSTDVARLVRQEGRKALVVRADVANASAVHRMVTKVISTFGRIDLLINNAAVFLAGSVHTATEASWDRTIDINLKGSFLCSQAVSRHMLKEQSGTIINIASLGGLQGWVQHLPYSVSKAGVIMLTKVLAKSLAPHVRVNAIAPGTILMRGEEDAGVRHVPKKTIPMKRYGTPADVADLVLYLATKGRYITGQVFPVDGGRSIQ